MLQPWILISPKPLGLARAFRGLRIYILLQTLITTLFLSLISCDTFLILKLRAVLTEQLLVVMKFLGSLFQTITESLRMKTFRWFCDPYRKRKSTKQAGPGYILQFIMYCLKTCEMPNNILFLYKLANTLIGPPCMVC